ncbi:MAG: hypothetical protein AABN95_10340 [Acidobacteriota bacterium]
MTNLRSTLHLCVVVIIVAVTASVAQGQASRTWVSGVGDDVNPCSRTTPCRTFAGAIAKTAIGGEIGVLDPSGYGVIVISKSVTIDGTGTMASVVAGSGSTGITINITNAADTARSVRIRGLSINGVGTGTHGINVIAASKVSIEDTIIDGFTRNGLNVAAGQVFVRNTTIRNNENLGISVAPGAQAGISDVSLVFNGTGMSGPIVPFNNVVFYANKNAPVGP